MAPRTLQRAPGYNLDVKTRVPTGNIQKTQQPNLTPASDPSSPIAEGLGFLSGLAKIGYSIGDFFNQNNQRNADKNWNDMLPDVQETYNFMQTKDVEKLPELNNEALKKYQDHINSLDYNDKTKEKMLNSLSDYAARKMEGNYAAGISEDKVANIVNLDARILNFIKDEDINGALRAINNATFAEDAWLDAETAITMREKVLRDGYYEITKNDLAEMDYRTAYDTLVAQDADEKGNLFYLHYQELSGAERSALESSIVQAGNFEERRKKTVETDAMDKSLNGLYSNEISVADFMKSNASGLDEAAKIQVVNTFENQQLIDRARRSNLVVESLQRDINNEILTDPQELRDLVDPNLSETARAGLIADVESRADKIAADPYWNRINNGEEISPEEIRAIDDPNMLESTRTALVAATTAIASKNAAAPYWKRIIDGDLTNPQVIRDLDVKNLEDSDRKIMVDYLTARLPVDRTRNPVTIAKERSKLKMEELRAQAVAGVDGFSIIRAALDLTSQIDKETDLPELFATDYDQVKKSVEDNASLKKLTAIVSGAEKDPRFEDSKTGKQNEAMFDLFTREYTDLFFDQIHEEDPEKQMNMDQFRQMADKLIETISNEDLQKEFDNAARSRQNVGTGLGTSWYSNKTEAAITALNEGLYDAMKYIAPDSWALFKRKMITQYEEITGKPYNERIRMYKDKVPVFTNSSGEEEMIVIVGNIPQVVSLDKGLNTYKNLALGYNVGDRNAEGETMLTSGWFNIRNNNVDILGSAYGGSIIQPKGHEEMYVVYESFSGMEIRPFHGNANDKSEIAKAIKEVSNPVIEDGEVPIFDDSVDKAILKATPPNFYIPGQSEIVPESIAPPRRGRR